MKILVIGAGSIGRRHISNLLALGHEAHAYSHRFASGMAHALPEGARLVSDLGALQAERWDGVVVANRTDQHLDTAMLALQNCTALFIEKPIAPSLQGLADFQDACQAKQAVVEIGFMMRLHPSLVWIKQYIESGQLGQIMHLHASLGQWLPDWRPGTDHRQGFGAFYRYGGGVILELIHELDLAQWMLGSVIDVSAMHRQVDALEIQTEAIAEMTLRTADGALAHVHLDYVRPGFGRTLEIVGTQGVLQWDYNRGSVVLIQANLTTEVMHQDPPHFERNTLFKNHMEHFLRRIADPKLAAISSLDNGVQALRVALAAHLSARQRRHVRPSEVPDTPFLEDAMQ